MRRTRKAPPVNENAEREGLLNMIDEIRHRIGTVERIQVMAHRDKVIYHLRDVLRDSEKKRQILTCCSGEWVSKAELMRRTGLSPTALANHTSALADADLLLRRKVGRHISFRTAPLLDHIDLDKEV